ncbi:MAG: transposase [Rhodocyclaceae bacterium]|nr:transposase [Rhodocyclaceae bacterium]MCA3144919.1 transposase [Rhodocyclaceae bacterium]
MASHQRKELERLCRYITRPALANERLSRNAKRQVVLKGESPYRDGTTHIVLQPQAFTRRLAARVPCPPIHPQLLANHPLAQGFRPPGEAVEELQVLRRQGWAEVSVALPHAGEHRLALGICHTPVARLAEAAGSEPRRAGVPVRPHPRGRSSSRPSCGDGVALVHQFDDACRGLSGAGLQILHRVQCRHVCRLG